MDRTDVALIRSKQAILGIHNQLAELEIEDMTNQLGSVRACWPGRRLRTISGLAAKVTKKVGLPKHRTVAIES